MAIQNGPEPRHPCPAPRKRTQAPKIAIMHTAANPPGRPRSLPARHNPARPPRLTLAPLPQHRGIQGERIGVAAVTRSPHEKACTTRVLTVTSVVNVTSVTGVTRLPHEANDDGLHRGDAHDDCADDAHQGIAEGAEGQGLRLL